MYSVLRVLGHGSTSIVYLVSNSGAYHALKRIPLYEDIIPVALQTMSRVTAIPYICSVESATYTVDPKRNLFLNIFTQVYTGTAKDFFRMHRASFLTLAIFVQDVLAGLSELHSVCYAMNGLTPENVLFRISNGKLRFALCGFGGSYRGSATDFSTPARYCAIERACCQSEGCVSDVYALGICLLEVMGVQIGDYIRQISDHVYVVYGSFEDISQYIYKIADLEIRTLLLYKLKSRHQSILDATNQQELDSFRAIARQCLALPEERPEAKQLLEQIRISIGSIDDHRKL